MQWIVIYTFECECGVALPSVGGCAGPYFNWHAV